MRVTPRKVLWVVVVSAFVFTIKDDVVSVVRDDTLGPPMSAEELVAPPSPPDVPAMAPVPVQPHPDLVDQLPPRPETPEEQEIHDWEVMQAARKHNQVQICHEIREHADVEFPSPDVLFKYMAVDHVHKVIHCPYQGEMKTNNYKRALSWSGRSSLRVKQKSEGYLGKMEEAPPPAFLQDLAKTQAESAAAGGGAAGGNGTGGGNATGPATAHDLEFGHNYTQEQVEYMMQHYVKIMFPDHPYERLLAVFDQKFSNRSDEIGTTLGRAIIRMSRPEAKWKEVTDSPVYFHEYMNFVLKKKGTISDFMIYYDMCHVCDMNWDYIGKTDTYDRDVTHIIKAVEGEVAASHNATAEDTEMREEPEVQQHMSDNYRNVTEWEMLRLYDDFSLDMYLFEYQWPFYNLTLMRDDPTKDGKYA